MVIFMLSSSVCVTTELLTLLVATAILSDSSETIRVSMYRGVRPQRNSQSCDVDCHMDSPSGSTSILIVREKIHLTRVVRTRYVLET